MSAYTWKALDQVKMLLIALRGACSTLVMVEEANFLMVVVVRAWERPKYNVDKSTYSLS